MPNRSVIILKINIVEENKYQEIRLKKRDDTRNNFIQGINQNELMSKKVCTFLNYIEHLLIFGSTVAGFVFISAFTSSVGMPLVIASSAVGIKIWAIFSGIERCKSIIKKKITNMIK